MRITLRGTLGRRAVAGFGRAAPTGLLASSDTAVADAIAGSGILSVFNVRAGSGADRGSDGCCGTGPKGSVGSSSTSVGASSTAATYSSVSWAIGLTTGVGASATPGTGSGVSPTSGAGLKDGTS